MIGHPRKYADRLGAFRCSPSKCLAALFIPFGLCLAFGAIAILFPFDQADPGTSALLFGSGCVLLFLGVQFFRGTPGTVSMATGGSAGLITWIGLMGVADHFQLKSRWLTPSREWVQDMAFLNASIDLAIHAALFIGPFLLGIKLGKITATKMRARLAASEEAGGVVRSARETTCPLFWNGYNDANDSGNHSGHRPAFGSGEASSCDRTVG